MFKLLKKYFTMKEEELTLLKRIAESNDKIVESNETLSKLVVTNPYGVFVRTVAATTY